MNMRTVTGRIWYSVSEDDGHSWREPEVLRYRDGGAEVLHPKSPDPLYRLEAAATCFSTTTATASIRTTPVPGTWRRGGRCG